MEVIGQAVGGPVHVHRRDHDPVAQGQAAQPERLEHGRADLAGAVPAVPFVPGEPAVHRVGELRVAQLQVAVGDPAAAGHDVERELERVLAGVLTEVLEPLQAGLRRLLGGEDDGAALRLVGREGTVDVGLLVQAGGQRECVLHRQLRPGADGEVGRVRRVAQQDHVAVPPALVPDRGEADPA